MAAKATAVVKLGNCKVDFFTNLIDGTFEFYAICVETRTKFGPILLNSSNVQLISGSIPFESFTRMITTSLTAQSNNVQFTHEFFQSSSVKEDFFDECSLRFIIVYTSEFEGQKKFPIELLTSPLKKDDIDYILSLSAVTGNSNSSPSLSASFSSSSSKPFRQNLEAQIKPFAATVDYIHDHGDRLSKLEIPCSNGLSSVRIENLEQQVLAIEKKLDMCGLPLNSMAKWQSTSGAANGAYWNWNNPIIPANANFYNCNGNTITVKQGGTYLILIRACGTSTGNNLYLQLYISGVPGPKCSSSNANGYVDTWSMNEIVQLTANCTLQVYQATNGNPYNDKESNQFSIVRLN